MHVCDKKDIQTSLLSIGLTLSKERKQQGHSVEDVADYTRIRVAFLSAIENGEFDLLPEGIYPRLYVKSYCEFLKIDPSELLEKFDDVSDEEDETKIEEQRVKASYRDVSPAQMVVVLSLFFALFAGAIYVIQENNQEILQTKDVEKIQEEEIASVAPISAEMVVMVGSPMKVSLIDEQGKVVKEKEMDEADVLFIPKDGELVIQAKNLEDLIFFADGNKVASFENLEQKNEGLVVDVYKLLANVESEMPVENDHSVEIKDVFDKALGDIQTRKKVVAKPEHSE